MYWIEFKNQPSACIVCHSDYIKNIANCFGTVSSIATIKKEQSRTMLKVSEKCLPFINNGSAYFNIELHTFPICKIEFPNNDVIAEQTAKEKAQHIVDVLTNFADLDLLNKP